MIYNSYYTKQANKRRSFQIRNSTPRLTFSPPNSRINLLSVQNSKDKQWKLLRYTFSSKNLKRFDYPQQQINNNNINCHQKEYKKQRRNTFENLKNAVLELQNKINKVNSDFFNNNKQKNSAVNLVKNKQKPVSGFKELIKSKPQTIRPMSHLQNKQFQQLYKNSFSEITCQTSSTIQTNSFKPLFGTNSNNSNNNINNHQTKPVTKISQYITSQPMPQNFHIIHNSLINHLFTTQDKNLYYLNQIYRASNQKNSLALQHINSSIKMIKCCILEKQKFKIQYQSNNQYQIYSTLEFKKMFKMQRLQKNWNKKTLILDLDQTLIHCYEQLDVETDMKLKIDIQGQMIQVGVNIRPYALSFLKRMAKKFEIVIFTASHQSYANVILDQLDPDNQIFSHRFYRQHCIVLSNGLHIKDLSYLPRDLKNLVLVDNAAYSYSFQLLNGIPIFPFYEGKDHQLIGLQKYLEKLLQVQDVREYNKRYFKLNQYAEFETAEEVIRQVYGKDERFYRYNHQ